MCGSESSLDQDLRTFSDIVADDLGGAVESDKVGPLCPVLPVAPARPSDPPQWRLRRKQRSFHRWSTESRGPCRHAQANSRPPDHLDNSVADHSALDETIYCVRHDAIRIRVEIRRLCPPLLQVHNFAAPRIIPSPGKISFVVRCEVNPRLGFFN